MACNARLCVVLPPVWDRDEHQRTTNEYKEKLASGHYDFCVWKGSKSPDWFLGLPKRTYAEWLCDFQTRFDSLVQLRDNTPFIHDNALHHLDGLDGEMIGSLLTLVKHSESDFDLTACVLAMCGWEASASTCGASQHIIITCSTCKRRILHSSLLVVSDLQHTTVKHQSSPTKRQTNSIDTIVMKTPSEEKTSSYESNRLVEGDNADGACREREEHDTTGSSNVCSVPTETDVTQRDSEDGNAGVRRVEGRETSMAANSEEGDDITATEREQVCSKNGAMESTPTRDDQHTPQSLISNLFKVERLPFDVISEHSSWCPWISPPYVSTIAKTKVLTACQPGWQALVDLLSPSSCSTHQRAKTSAGETVTTVRKLLKTFT
ncbi:zinc finger C3HC-type protein 1-like [Corticium candelabrum]|uniref:zinc finger C3HC-type protein 1-like n=1 Tax=Corticium candelabrum TaxID=121492 RepID=UPI002E276241|nr:zinc finger C3HC-type protein 1-like [Corticium candelabrum]